MKRIRFAAFALCVFWAACAKAPAPPAAPDVPAAGIDALARPDRLAFVDPAVKVGMVSSYDRTGGNDDGFSGKYSFVRKEPGGLVLADLEGPGAVTRFHTPTPTDDVIEFYFDGETAPRLRLKVNELFDGTHAPFLAPLVWTGVGGSVSYAPLPYQKSLKIVVKAPMFQFIQINHADYPPGTAVETFTNPASAAYLRKFEEAAKILRLAGSDLSAALAPPGAVLETKRVDAALAPGGTVTLFESSRPGRVVGLRLGPAGAFAGGDRDIVIRMFWDGAAAPSVVCPAGDFFGNYFGRPAVRSLFLGTAGDTGYLYLPMPFEKSARIELASERKAGPAVHIRAEIIHCAVGKAAGEGRLNAVWRRENPAREGIPYTYLRTAGRGKIVGVILQAQGPQPGQTPFFEGDDHAVLDGELAIPGTGSEDSFNGGWYDVPGRWFERESFPLSGCLGYEKPLARTGGYRWFISDAYFYGQSAEFTIEHGPEGNHIPTDYTSVAFFYALDPSAGEPLPAREARRVAAPDRIVFNPSWSVPLKSFSLRQATLAKKTIVAGKEKIDVLSLRAEGEDIFGPHHIAFACVIPEAGRYRVAIQAVPGPDQGIVQLAVRDRPAGKPADLYAPGRKRGERLELGVLELDEGENALAFRLIGKNPRSSGLGLDLVEIVLERER